jgi:hypothetical protein
MTFLNPSLSYITIMTKSQLCPLNSNSINESVLEN